MSHPLSRRSLLASAALLPPLFWLAGCGEDETQAEGPAAKGAPKSVGTVDMAKVLEPGPLPDMVLGKADAPVTIVEYASMTCPHCARFHEKTLPDIKEKYLDTGKARLIFREFLLDPRDSRAMAGFMLSRCSGEKYFPMVDVLFRQQANWVPAEDGRGALLQLAKLAGFSQSSFEACLTDKKLDGEVRAVGKRGADEFGVNSTPTFFINGKVYKGEMTVEQMSALIDGLLAV